jgi:hypothetical protein
MGTGEVTPLAAYTGSKAQAGRGSLLSIGATPTPVGEVADVPFNRPEWETVDTTNFDSGIDEEQLVTIRRASTFSITGNRVSSDAGQIAAETAYQSGALTAFTFALPKTTAQTTTGDTYSFKAYVKGSNFKVSPTGKVEFTLNLQTSGPVTVQVGS